MYTINQLNEIARYEAESMAMILNSLVAEEELPKVQNPDDASDNDETTIDKLGEDGGDSREE